MTTRAQWVFKGSATDPCCCGVCFDRYGANLNATNDLPVDCGCRNGVEWGYGSLRVASYTGIVGVQPVVSVGGAWTAVIGTATVEYFMTGDCSGAPDFMETVDVGEGVECNTLTGLFRVTAAILTTGGSIGPSILIFDSYDGIGSLFSATVGAPITNGLAPCGDFDVSPLIRIPTILLESP